MPNQRATSNLNQHAIVRKTKQLTFGETMRFGQQRLGKEESKAEKGGTKSSMARKVQVTQDDFLFGT